MRKDFIRAGSLLRRTRPGVATTIQRQNRKLLVNELAVVISVAESAKFSTSNIHVIGSHSQIAVCLMTMDGSTFVYGRADFFMFWSVVDE